MSPQAAYWAKVERKWVQFQEALSSREEITRVGIIESLSPHRRKATIQLGAGGPFVRVRTSALKFANAAQIKEREGT